MSSAAGDAGWLLCLNGEVDESVLRTSHLDVVLSVTPLCIDSAAAVLLLHSEDSRGAPHALLASYAG